MKNNIAIVSSGQPSLNPRAVKEANALSAADYQVTLIYLHRHSWADPFDRELFAQAKWRAVCAGGRTATNSIRFLIDRTIHWLARKMYRFPFLGPGFKEHAIDRGISSLMREAIKHPANLYIAHTPAALPAAYRASKKHRAAFGFDAEDFHRFETSDDQNAPQAILAREIEDRYLPHINYLSASSPLITAEYQKLYPTRSFSTILNVFSSVKSQPAKKPGLLKLFWFSQTIGEGRGIENLLDALAISSQPVELHLLGNVNTWVRKRLADKCRDIGIYEGILHFHAPIASDQIIPFAQQFDIGICSEIGQPYNRNICLTNKLFTYLQAGLAIIASDTRAQAQFFSENPDSGLIYKKNDATDLARCINTYMASEGLLTRHKTVNVALGIELYNWEKESLKLLSVVKNTLGQ